MLVSCHGIELSDAFMSVSKAISNKITNPILEGIKIVAEDDTLTFSATDTELSIEKKIKANTLQIMVDDAESFLDFLSNNDKVSLQEVEQNILFPDGEIPSFQDALSLNLIREGYGKGKISFCIKNIGI